MANLTTLEDTFIPRKPPKLELDISGLFHAQQTPITLRIHKSVLERVLDYCDDEDISPDGEEHYIVRYPFLENDYYYGILLSLGDKCECLSPEHVRMEMKRRIADMARVYGG